MEELWIVAEGMLSGLAKKLEKKEVEAHGTA